MGDRQDSAIHTLCDPLVVCSNASCTIYLTLFGRRSSYNIVISHIALTSKRDSFKPMHQKIEQLGRMPPPFQIFAGDPKY